MLRSLVDRAATDVTDLDTRVVAEAAQVLSSSVDYEATLEHVAALVVPSHADWSLIDLVADDGETFERVAVAHQRPEGAVVANALKRTYDLRCSSGRGVQAAVRDLQTQVLASVDDTVLRGLARDDEHLRAIRALAARSFVTVPLVVRGRAIGALTLVSCERDYESSDARFAEQFALAAAAAIENARLFRAEKRARARLERMRDVIAALSRARTTAEVADQACRIGSQAMDAHSGAMWLLRDDGALWLAGSWGTPAGFIEQFRTIGPDTGAPAQHVARTGEALWVETDEDYRRIAPTIYPRVKAEGRVASYGVVPLLALQKPIGVITFAHPMPHTYDADERAFYVSLAQHCAQALERAILFDERRRSEAHFRLAIEAAPTAMIMVDRQGCITLANAQVQAVFGYAPSELVGQPLKRLLPEHLHELHPSFRHAFYEDPKARPMGAGRDLYGRHKNGSEVAVEIGLTPLETADGQLVLASIVDISERVAQRRRIELLQSVTASLSKAASAEEVARVIVEEGAQCVGALQGGVWLLSRDSGELELTYSRGYGEPMQRALGRVPLDGETPLARSVRERTSLWVDAQTSYFCVPLVVHDRCLGAMSFNWPHGRTFEANEKKLVEALSLQGAQALERALLFDEAEGGRRRLLEASRMKDEFLAVVSHELRTPLNAVLGWAAMLRTKSDVDAPRAIATIERNARAQLRLIEDMLDASRIVTGKLKIDPKRIDLGSVLRSGLSVVGPMAATKGVAIEASLDGGPHPIHGDPDRLQQVFWNLLSNAVKFTPKDGLVRLRVARVGANVEVIISDTGRGIPAEFLPYVFDRFRQADASKTRTQPGLGLGLAIARHIVELHDGTIRAESPGAGGGATFIVSLPVSAELADAPSIVEESGAPSRSRPRDRPLEGLSIVVCDDDADARDLLYMVLTAAGAAVRVSSMASEALQHVKDARPDVLLSDIGLPLVDGYSLMREIRKLPNERGGRTPAIALTAYASGEDARLAFEAGYQLHVAKPIEPGALVTVVANVAGRAPAR